MIYYSFKGSICCSWLLNGQEAISYEGGKVVFAEGQYRPLGDTATPRMSKSSIIYPADKKYA